jgi:hypothetical protein
LNSVWNRRPKTKCVCTSHSLSSDDSDDQHLEDLEIENSGKHPRTKKSKGTGKNCDATNIGFYPPFWQKLLNHTKANFRLHLAISVPFPNKEESIGNTGVCGEVIAEAIVQWQEQKRKLKKGTFISPTTMLLPADMSTKATTLNSKWAWLLW